MSDILIKGMEMPKSCYECPIRKRKGLKIVCPVLQEEFTIADVNILFFRLKDCPIIPVHDHGRLIDADELPISFDGFLNIILKDDVDNAPTIIPASMETST